MNSSQKQQAYELRQQGYSIRDIEKELDIPKSTIDAFLRNYTPPTSEEDLSGIDETLPSSGPVKNKKTEGSESLGMLQANLSHEREMAKLALQRDEQDLKRKELQLRESEVQNNRKQLDIQKQAIQQEAHQQHEKVESVKRVYVGRFNRIVTELLDNCGDDDTWSADEVADLLDRAETLKEKIEVFTDRHEIERDELAIYANLESLIEYILDTTEERSGLFSSTIVFAADEEQQEEIESWRVSHFDEQVEEEDEEDEDDEDEDDEDEEDEDEEDEDEEEDEKPYRRKR